jgi:UPF0271 protein
MLQHVKPHGALYNMAVPGGELARAICEAVLEIDRSLILLVLAGSPYGKIAEDMGVRVAREAFADRAFNADGSLVPRSRPGAVIHDMKAVVERSLRMVVDGTVVAVTGEVIPMKADTVCLHGDTPGAVTLAAELKARFERAGVQLVPLDQLV